MRQVFPTLEFVDYLMTICRSVELLATVVQLGLIPNKGKDFSLHYHHPDRPPIQ